jgi:polyhydroxybutyrate depolymerase
LDIAVMPAVEKTINIDGLERRYLVFVPRRVRETMPVVLAFHGGGGSPRQMEQHTGLDDVAEREGFVLAYPESVGSNWNDGRGETFILAQRENINDVAFVRRLLDVLAEEHKINRGRVFATGISNGAAMSHRLAAEASDVIAGIAPVVGGMAPAIAETFKPEFPVSILIIQGDSDPFVPIAGGTVVAGRGRARGEVPPMKDVLEMYVRRNGNTGDPVVTTLGAQPDDGTSVEITKYPEGPGGVKSWCYVVKNGGHAWPGRPALALEAVIGKVSQQFSATETIWEFFRDCPGRMN